MDQHARETHGSRRVSGEDVAADSPAQEPEGKINSEVAPEVKSTSQDEQRPSEIFS